MSHPHTSPDVVVIVPAYNEARVIEPTVAKLLDYFEGEWAGRTWQLVLAENGSTDNTPDVIRRLVRRSPRSALTSLHLKRAGRGRALKATVAQFPGRIYLYVDADLPVELADLDRLIKPIADGGSDITVGRRAGTRPLVRRLMTRGLQWVTYLQLGLNVRDAQCGAKAFSADAALLLSSCARDDYFLDLEFLATANQRGLNVTEVPVTWIDRRFAARPSKVRKVRDSWAAWQATATVRRQLKTKGQSRS
jgi:glycosyltransferase involved in cell wall biosynthesis